MRDTLQEENNKFYFGKFLYGEKNLQDNKEVFILFIKLNKFLKNNFNKILLRKRQYKKVSTLTKLTDWFKFTTNFITVINNFSLLKTFQKHVPKKPLKLLHSLK